MKKYGSTKAKARVAKNTVRKMLNMPFCAYWVQISTTFLLSATEALVLVFQLDVGLDELDGAVGAGGDRLGGRAGEPIDHRAAGDQTEQERRVKDGEVRDQLRLQTLGQHHDDGEDHRGGADHGGADEHRLGGGLEGVACAVVLFEILLGTSKLGSKPNSFLISPLMLGMSRWWRVRRPTGRCRSPDRRSRPRW